MKLPRNKKLVFALVTMLLLTLLLEGLLSFVWIAVELRADFRSSKTDDGRGLARMSQYDPELGWTSLKDKTLPDFYGKGRSITYNSQGIRGLREYPAPKPDDRFRMACFGDSFTFGHGVNDPDAYPAQLEAAHPWLDAVNFAVPGYSVGQMWLRHNREVDALDPDFILVALICMDIKRMRVGVPEFENRIPKFRLAEGKVETYNLPVPKPKTESVRPAAVSSPWFGVQFVARKSALARTLKLAVPERQFGPENVTDAAFEDLTEVACLIFADMNRRAREAGRGFGVVLIPAITDISREYDAELYAKTESRLARLAAAEQFPMLSLRGSFMDRSEEEWRALYLDRRMDPYEHCGAVGNRLIAGEVHHWLMSVEPRYAAMMRLNESVAATPLAEAASREPNP